MKIYTDRSGVPLSAALAKYSVTEQATFVHVTWTACNTTGGNGHHEIYDDEQEARQRIAEFLQEDADPLSGEIEQPADNQWVSPHPTMDWLIKLYPAGTWQDKLRGGKRDGAGRKPNQEKGLPVRSETLSVKVETELADWVKANGGSELIRRLLLKEFAESDNK